MDEPLDCSEVDTPFRGIRRAHHFHPEAVGEGQVLNLVGDIVVACREYDVARREADRGQCCDERSRGVFAERDIRRRGAKQFRYALVCGGDLRRGLRLCLVPADTSFEIQLRSYRVHDRAWHKRCPRVVEVHAVRAPWGVRSKFGNVHGSQGSWHVNWRQASTLPGHEFHIAQRAAHASRTDLKKKRILVVDDE